MSAYSTIVKAFGPKLDLTQVNTDLTSMESNGSDLQKDIDDTNKLYLDYVDKTLTDTQDYMKSVQDSIQQTDTDAQKSMDESIGSVKDTKTKTSQQNQDLLEGFTKKLAYTRNGSMDNNTTYEFISNPILLNPIQKK